MTTTTTNQQLEEIIYLYSIALEACSTAGKKVKTFQLIKELHVCLKDKVSDNTAFNEITQYLRGKTSCMNLCGGVCENICHLNAEQFDQYIKRNNLDDKLILITTPFIRDF